MLVGVHVFCTGKNVKRYLRKLGDQYEYQSREIHGEHPRVIVCIMCGRKEPAGTEYQMLVSQMRKGR